MLWPALLLLVLTAPAPQRDSDDDWSQDARAKPSWRSSEGYQKLRWGMTRRAVKRLMPKTRWDSSKGILSFDGSVADIPATTLLYFAQDKLTDVTVSFHPVGRMRSEDEAFDALNEALAAKYGGEGELYGDGSREWTTDNTTIRLTLAPLEIVHRLTIHYESKELEFLRATLDNAAAKEL